MSFEYKQVLAPCAAAINVNQTLLALYIHRLLPSITQPGDDGNYGSAGMYDVMALQVCQFWHARIIVVAPQCCE